MKIALIVGTRPNIVKASSLCPALRAAGHEVTLIHTGQHADPAMSEQFFRELEIAPDVRLEVKQYKHSIYRMSDMLDAVAFELLTIEPNLVIVVGDCDTALAGALAAKKLGIPVAHVEAGLRAPDAVQENLNRVLVDHASDVLFVSEESGMNNLFHEGLLKDRMELRRTTSAFDLVEWHDSTQRNTNVHLVGNVMIDTLVRFKEKIMQATPSTRPHSVGRNAIGNELPYAVLTLHRAENVDDPLRLQDALATIRPACERMPVIFPAHPRTVKKLNELLAPLANVLLVAPLGYFDFVNLLAHATVVLTDSGGIQEETTALGVPCLTLRESTERPATLVPLGTNKLVGFNAENVEKWLCAILTGQWSSGRGPASWDGHAAQRIARILSGAAAHA